MTELQVAKLVAFLAGALMITLSLSREKLKFERGNYSALFAILGTLAWVFVLFA